MQIGTSAAICATGARVGRWACGEQDHSAYAVVVHGKHGVGSGVVFVVCISTKPVIGLVKYRAL